MPQLYTTQDGKTATLIEHSVEITKETEFDVFERTAIYYPLTTELKPGSTFSGDLVWQYKIDGDEEWSTENSNAYKRHASFKAYTEFYEDKTIQTRQAVHPSTASEKPVEGKESVSVEADILILKNGLKEHCCLISQYNNKGGEADYQTASEISEAINRLDHALQSSNLVSLEEVVEVLERIEAGQIECRLDYLITQIKNLKEKK